MKPLIVPNQTQADIMEIVEYETLNIDEILLKINEKREIPITKRTVGFNVSFLMKNNIIRLVYKNLDDLREKYYTLR